MQESALLLELMTQRMDTIKTVIVEVDLNLANDGFSPGTRALFLPFLQTNAAVSAYYEPLMDDFSLLKYIPFYKYLLNDYELGIRQLLMTVVNKKAKTFSTQGFAPLNSTGTQLNLDIYKSYPKQNNSYEHIKKICRERGIKLIAITTPVCQQTLQNAYFEKVVQLYPEVYRLDQLITEDQCFSSCGHLNAKGATLFTNHLLKTFFH